MRENVVEGHGVRLILLGYGGPGVRILLADLPVQLLRGAAHEPEIASPAATATLSILSLCVCRIDGLGGITT